MLDDGTIVVASDDALHYRSPGGAHAVRRSPVGRIDHVTVSDGRLLVLGEGGLAVGGAGAAPFRVLERWVGTGSRARVRGAMIELLDTESLSCVGSWTVRSAGPIAHMERGLRPLPFPDERGEDSIGVPTSMLAFLRWGFGANGWLYAKDDERMHALRGRAHFTIPFAVGDGYRDLDLAHGGGKTFALYGDRLLELTPRRARLVDVVPGARALAVDPRGRPYAIAGSSVVRWAGGAPVELAVPCSASVHRAP